MNTYLRSAHVSDPGFLIACAFWLGLLGVFGAAGATNSAEAGRYRAVVTDSGGQGIAGASVEVFRYPEDWRGGLELATNLTTGADGSFKIPWVNYSLFIVRRPGLAPAWRELRPDQTNRTPVVLSAPATLAGVVVDETGKPVSQAEVFVCAAHLGARTDWTTMLGARFARPLFSTRTDADGRFEIANFPTNAMAELDVRAPGKVLPPRRVQYSPGGLLWHSGQQDIRLVVEPPAELTGQVKTETGETLANARVELRPTASFLAVPSWESVRGVTNGVFRFTGVAAGAYRLFAQFGTNSPPDWVAEPVPVTLRSGQNLQGVVITAAKGGVLRVRSLDRRTGKPLKGVFFTLYAGSDYLHQTSDDNGLGWYRLLAGRYSLHGESEEGLPQYAPVQVQVEAGQTNEATLEFSPPPLVSGLVRDPEGKPAAGVNVWLHPGWRNQEVKTDSQGRYQVVHKENPQVVLVVDSVRHLAASREIEAGVTNLDLQLAPALTITGRAEDTQGKPIPKAKGIVYLRCGDWGFPVGWQPITTDAQGAFKVVNLPADRKYYIRFSSAGYGSAQPPVPTDEGNTIELPPVVLRKAGLRLAGRVVDESETPLANANINVDGNGQPDLDVMTDAQGRFALEVCPGTVHLWVWFESMQTSVDAPAGETNLVIVLKPRTREAEVEQPKRPSLIGKALPGLAVANLPADAAVTGKPLLLCLFDCEQRPSRRMIQLLTEQHDSLRQKGVTVLAIQAAPASESFSRWSKANAFPFKIGRITERNAVTAWATETDALPWLILVNAQGRVVAEGFPFEDLADKLTDTKYEH